MIWAANKASVAARLIHTGQHYDEYMSDVFLKEFGLPKPHVHLGVGSGSHGEVTGRCLERIGWHLWAGEKHLYGAKWLMADPVVKSR